MRFGKWDPPINGQAKKREWIPLTRRMRRDCRETAESLGMCQQEDSKDLSCRRTSPGNF